LLGALHLAGVLSGRRLGGTKARQIFGFHSIRPRCEFRFVSPGSVGFVGSFLADVLEISQKWMDGW